MALKHIQQLLSSPVAPELSPDLAGNDTLCQLHELLAGLRSILSNFASGDLSSEIRHRGFMSGTLKALQAHLRHLTWQVQQVEQGDFTQRVDFLGDFSSAFNNMVIQLDTTLSALRKKEEALTKLTQTLQQEVDLRSAAVLALRRSESRFKYLAEHDPLTDTLNRRSFLSLVTIEIQTAVLTSSSCCVALLDVDHFKAFNDTHGHLAGDEALRHLVRVAGSSLRQADLMGRYGGEEFIFFFSGSNIEQGVKAANRIRRAVELNPVELADKSVPIACSLGVCVILPEWQGERNEFFLQSAIDMADQALYAAKNRGRNRVVAAPSVPPEIVRECFEEG